ncbi:MAG: hypothetical protein AB7O59_09920 [Pirellulales bacterium]
MAISAVQYAIVREMFRQGWLAQGGAILEIGEANWYGDADPHDLVAEIEQHVAEPRRAALTARLHAAFALDPRVTNFEVAKVFYEMFFAPTEMQAIDWNGSPQAHRLDLNDHLQLARRFDVVINHGTAEHIFNIAQVFRTMHEHTVPGGMMIHESPFTGWIDHGFYTLHPRLFFDLAEANGYRLRSMFVEDFAGRQAYPLASRESIAEMRLSRQLPENALLFVVFQKDSDAPFQVPRQRRVPTSAITSMHAAGSPQAGRA